MDSPSDEDTPIFDGDEEYITRGQHWRMQQGIRQRFEHVERRLDEQFDNFHDEMLIIGRQMEAMNNSIADLAHRRRHRHSSSSSSTHTQVSRDRKSVV